MDENVQRNVAKIVHSEYYGEETAQELKDFDFERVLDVLECKRNEKDYDWMSDVFIPEYPSIHLTEASQWANQYFQTRDFVEVYLSGHTEESRLKAEACKRLINNMLNIKTLYHYPKYIKARSINSMRGYVIAVCGWKQVLQKEYQTKPVKEYVGVDDYGNPRYSETMQTEEITIPVVDHFYYEVPDPRNVRFDKTYCYSIQDKEWVTVRSRMTYEMLKAKEEECDYFNLDEIKKWRDDGQTDFEKKTLDRDDTDKSQTKGQLQYFDVLERFGKIWADVTEHDDDGYPLKANPGYDELGKPKEGASLIEAIVTIVTSGSKQALIRFQPTPFRTSTGQPFRPLVRGLCYIHPTKDVGMSDGLYGLEMQRLINDMMNLGIDRTKLATFPTLKMRRYAFEDNDTVYFQPEHPILVENMDDVEEFKIQDDINGALDIVGFAINKLQQVQSIYPTTMGDMPGKASTTATAIQGAEQRTNIRANYKSLTFEYTFLQEFYWMILQMAFQFIHPATIEKILGEYTQFFDPNEDYNYKPVTSSVESEYQKDVKIQRIDQMMGRIGNIPNPGIIPIIAMLIGLECELLGQEFQTVAPLIRNLAATPNAPDKTTQGNPPEDAGAVPTSNQSGVPMSVMEQTARRM